MYIHRERERERFIGSSIEIKVGLTNEKIWKNNFVSDTILSEQYYNPDFVIGSLYILYQISKTYIFSIFSLPERSFYFATIRSSQTIRSKHYQ